MRSHLSSFVVCLQAPRGSDGPPAPAAEAAHRLAGRDRGQDQADGGPASGARPGGRQAPGGGAQGRPPVQGPPRVFLSSGISGFHAVAAPDTFLEP